MELSQNTGKFHHQVTADEFIKKHTTPLQIDVLHPQV